MGDTGFKGLGIRAKTLLALALTLGFGISVLVLTLRGSLNGFLRSEERRCCRRSGRHGTVAVLLDDLAAATAVHAAGEDSRRLESGAGTAPLRGPFTAARLAGGRIALAAVIDSRGALVDGAALGPSPPAVAPLPAAFLKYLRDNPGLFAWDGHPNGVKGILPLGPSPLLVATRPVDRGEVAGSGRSALLFGRYLEGDLMIGMATTGGVPEFIPASAGLQLPGEAREALVVMTAGEALFVSRPNAQIMTGTWCATLPAHRLICCG
jgi:hypothetical protein